MAITVRSSNGIIEYFSATEQQHTIDLSDAAVGDLRIIAVNFSPDGTATIGTVTTPSGWTEISNDTETGAASNSRLFMAYRLVQSGDTLTSATLAFTTSTSMACGSVAVTFEGIDATTQMDATPPTMATGTSPPVSPTITTVTDNAAILCACIIDAAPGFNDSHIPSGFTLLGTMANNPPSNGMNLGLAYQIQATAGASGTKTWGDGGSEEYAAATAAIRPSTVTREQEGFRFRNDDGSESAATWRQSQDTNDTVSKNTNERLRCLGNMTGTAPAEAATLQYKESSDATTEWRAVPT